MVTCRSFLCDVMSNRRVCAVAASLPELLCNAKWLHHLMVTCRSFLCDVMSNRRVCAVAASLPELLCNAKWLHHLMVTCPSFVCDVVSNRRVCAVAGPCGGCSCCHKFQTWRGTAGGGRPPCDWRTEIAFAQSHAKAPASWLRRDPAVLRCAPVFDQVLLHCEPMRWDRCGVLARVFACAPHAYLNMNLCLNSHDAADRNAIVPPPCQNFCAMQSGCIT